MPPQIGAPWLSIVPIAASRSSYNGLLVFLFMALSGTLAAYRDPPPRLRPAAPRAGLGLRLSRLRARRRNTPPMSFAQPIRRVFGTVVFRAREQVDMPPPGDMRPARLTVDASPIRSGIPSMRRSPSASALAADRLNRLQFLTIRQFLSLVFGALVILLLVLAIWS